MRKEGNLKSLKKSFNLYHKNEFFARFDFDEETNRYQSNYGYLSPKKVFEISKGKDEIGRRIEWLD